MFEDSRHTFHRRREPWMQVIFSLLLVHASLAQNLGNEVDFWNVERPKDMANLVSLEVMCGKTHMEVQVGFDRPFNGIIFSKGAVDQYNCIYVKPQTGSSTYSFNIMYDQCGTKPDMNGKFYENNIVIQYDKDLIEVWDEAKRLRCEWYNDYEKGITKPPIRVSDLEVVELNFRGDNVDCWMEIQHGKGPWASPVSGIVPLGTTLTMVVGINDIQGEFDMRVKSCLAEAENSRPIHLSDEHGCVLRPKMVSKFMKIAGADSRATVVTYAFFHAFKFPDSMSVHIKCKVEICRFGCPDHCQKPSGYTAREQVVSASVNRPQIYRPGPRFEAHKAAESRIDNNIGLVQNNPVKDSERLRAPVALRLVQDEPAVSESVQHPTAEVATEEDPLLAAVNGAQYRPPRPAAPPAKSNRAEPTTGGLPRQFLPEPLTAKVANIANAATYRSNAPAASHYVPKQLYASEEGSDPNNQRNGQQPRLPPRETDKQSANKPGGFFGIKLPKLPSLSKFFGGENNVDGSRREEEGLGESEILPMGILPQQVPTHRTEAKDQPKVYPSSFNSAGGGRVQPEASLPSRLDNEPVGHDNAGQADGEAGGFPHGPRGLPLNKRSARTRRSSEEMGVASGYQVISEVDLAFKPSYENGMGVTVFQGRILQEEMVYGICLPATGFSAIFVLISLLTIISVLVSGFVCYHRQVQKTVEEGAPLPYRATVTGMLGRLTGTNRTHRMTGHGPAGSATASTVSLTSSSTGTLSPPGHLLQQHEREKQAAWEVASALLRLPK